MINWIEFQELCKRELELCKVKKGELVVVLSQGDDRMDYADAFVTAARGLGAESYNLRLGDTSSVLNGPAVSAVGINPLHGNQSVIDALKKADLVIDLIFLLFSKEQREIQDSGTRILTCVEDKALLTGMFPTIEQRERVEFSAELLSEAKTLRFTNRAGTDVTYELQAYPIIEQYGYTDTPGRWDMWPGGFVFTGGREDGVNGKVVLDKGDIIAAPFRCYLNERIELTIESGMITAVHGDYEAELMNDYISSFNDKRGYAVSHIGWGLNEKVRWSSMATTLRSLGQEARAFNGNVMFATGPNQELGGTNDTPAHMDIPMRNCTLYLDDELILKDGAFAIPELQINSDG